MNGGIRVVHVDDDREAGEVVADVLEREDDRFTVETVTSGDAALDRLDDTVDCVVSDYDMPGRDGIELLEAVRNRRPELPFVLFTGKGGESVASEAISAGVTDYLQKGTGRESYTLLANRIRNAVSAHRSRQELRETKRRLDLALSGTDTGVWEWNTETDEVVWDETLERMLGLEPGTFEGSCEAFSRRIVPADRSLVDSAVERALETGEYDAELRMEHAEDGYRWIQTDGRFVNDRLIGVARDVTDWKRRERELRRTVERTEFALEATDAIVWVHDPTENEVVSRYGPVERLLGVSKDRIDTGETFLEHAVHPDDRDRVGTASRELADGQRESIQIRYRTNPAHGDVRWIEDTAERRSDGDGDRVIGLMRDVTDRTRRERELERRNERLEEFASVVSHDLRSPLNVAIGQLELAESDEERVDRALDALDRMSELIDDVLRLARAGDRVREPEPVHLPETVRACWRTGETGEATLVVETDRTVRADAAGLKQLFQNLFANAVKHADEPTVTVGHTADGIYVADDGPGIPPEKRDRVLESGYSTDDDGTGFGLTIVSRIADAHDWGVVVTESDDGGARIEVTGVEFVD